MSNPATIRLDLLLNATPDAQLRKLRQRHGPDLSSRLSDSKAIQARAARLGDPAADLLARLLEFEAFGVNESGRERQALRSLITAGLVFEVDIDGEGPQPWVPIEVRIALFADLTYTDASVAVHLAAWEPDELEGLASIHGIELADPDDVIGSAVLLADALVESERLSSLFESLPTATKRLVHWMCELDEVTPVDKVSAMAQRFAELVGDGSSTGDHVLARLGIAHEFELDGDSVTAIPIDLRDALRPIIELQLTDRVRSLYGVMRDEAVPSFRDAFPHGYAGNALVAARVRTLRAAAFGVDDLDPLDQVLVIFGAIELDVGVGQRASMLLDVATPDRFAQECLRGWLGSLDDEFTRTLIAPFGGDTVALADWIFSAESDTDPTAREDAADWSRFLFEFRATLLMTMSLLVAGHWYRVSSLSSLLAAAYRRLMWHAAGFRGVGDATPAHALPMPGVEVTHEEETKLREALVALMRRLLGPIGAVELDPSETLFMVNTEALCVFRDGDPAFDVIWQDVESFVGDDIDLWLPYPTSWGIRVCGVAPLRWSDDTVVDAPFDAHIHDLTRLVTWAHPLLDGSVFRFVFDEVSIARGADAEADADEFLTWLALRTGQPIPGPVRALFPISTAAIDQQEPLEAAVEVVGRALDSLDDWSDRPPSAVIESIRSWSAAAEIVANERFIALVNESRWSSAELLHLALLLGELGSVAAVPSLLRVVANSTIEATEGAAAMALARIGPTSFDGVRSLFENAALDIDKRLTCAGVLASIAVLYPTTCHEAFAVLSKQIGAAEDLPEDLPALIGIFIAETGHPKSEELLYSIQEQGLWVDSVMPFDEVLWIASISPSIWGHPLFAAPLAALFPTVADAERHRDELRAAALDPPKRGRKRKS